MSRLWARLPLQTTQKGVSSLQAFLNFLFPISKLVNFCFVSILSLLYYNPGASTNTPLSAFHIGDHTQCWQNCRCNKVVDVCNNKCSIVNKMFQLSIPETSQPYLQSWRTQPSPLGQSSEVRSSVSSASLKSQRRGRRC